MLYLTKFVAVAAVVVTSATVAGAQAGTTMTKPVAVGVSGGAAIPTGDLRAIADLGYNVTGSVALSVPALPVGLRLDAAYNSFDVKSELLSDAGVDNASGNVRVLGFTGNLVFPIPLQAVMVRPYLIGGIGLYNVRASATIRDQGNSTSDSMSENKFGFNLGGGVSIPLSGFNTFIEARYHRVNMQDGSFAYVPITVGVMF